MNLTSFPYFKKGEKLSPPGYVVIVTTCDGHYKMREKISLSDSGLVTKFKLLIEADTRTSSMFFALVTSASHHNEVLIQLLG